MLNFKRLKVMSRLRFRRALKRSICIEYMQSGKSRGTGGTGDFVTVTDYPDPAVSLGFS